MRGRGIISEEAGRTEKINDTDNQVIHDDLTAVLEALLDMRDLLVEIEKK